MSFGHRRALAVKRWRVVGPGLAVAGLLAAGFCLLGLPSAAAPLDRLRWWAVIMTGPAYATGSGHALFCGLVAVGWCGLLGAAHPIRPGRWSAAASVAGLGLWVGSGWLTVLVCVWGA